MQESPLPCHVDGVGSLCHEKGQPVGSPDGVGSLCHGVGSLCHEKGESVGSSMLIGPFYQIK